MKKIKEIYSPDRKQLLNQLTAISRSFADAVILNSNNYADQYGKYELLAAFGAQEKLLDFNSIEKFIQEKKQWLFGHFSYELKDQFEKLSSEKEKKFAFPLLQFFAPKHILLWKRGEEKATWYTENEKELLDLLAQNAEIDQSAKQEALPSFTAQLKKSEYLERVKALKEEIRYGNIYEVNFCQTFTAEATIDPQTTYLSLNNRSPMPFSTFYKSENDYLMGASPERFMAKRGKKLICQPIKGTARRSEDPTEDAKISAELQSDLKEQTENVMIVDLMRNDLSRTAARGSVKVEELFGVYSFPQVHQLISTVISELSEVHSSVDAIKKSFPMGSMTGAPKIKAMQLIEEWEASRRELYSGSIGYFDPEGDFDFNVVIRSLLYSAEKNFASLTVGGAITDLATAENEYHECLLKAKAIFDPTEQEE